MGHKMPQWSPAAKAGNTIRRNQGLISIGIASMEPGRKGREYVVEGGVGVLALEASMEPGRKGREYGGDEVVDLVRDLASMEPGRKGREYLDRPLILLERVRASMEPGRKGREYAVSQAEQELLASWPQWSPAAKAGNTGRARESPCPAICLNGARPQRPGIQGRRLLLWSARRGLNGARPQRPGIRRPCYPACGRPQSLNGARPQRPGIPPKQTCSPAPTLPPQWSPAAKAGNTGSGAALDGDQIRASMEPGRKGREYLRKSDHWRQHRLASMEPGRKGREYRENCS